MKQGQRRGLVPKQGVCVLTCSVWPVIQGPHYRRMDPIGLPGSWQSVSGQLCHRKWSIVGLEGSVENSVSIYFLPQMLASGRVTRSTIYYGSLKWCQLLKKKRFCEALQHWTEVFHLNYYYWLWDLTQEQYKKCLFISNVLNQTKLSPLI